MILSRRVMLASVAIAPLAGCSLFGSGGALSVTPTQLQADVAALADGLTTAVGYLSTIAGVPADTLAKVQAELAVLKADAAQIGATATPGTSTIQQISNVVGIIATLVGPFFPAASGAAMVIQAGLSILPEILSLVGITAVAATPKRFSAAQARVILIGAKTAPLN